MNRKNLKTVLYSSALAITILSTVIPAQGSIPVPPAPTETQAPAETNPPIDGNDINPLSDLEEQLLK